METVRIACRAQFHSAVTIFAESTPEAMISLLSPISLKVGMIWKLY